MWAADCVIRYVNFMKGINVINNYETPMAYQFRLSHDEQLKRSQSGGAFFAIADKFIANGGVVYGAAFTKNWRVTHQKANSSHTLSALRMSKYVQSDLRGSFTQVKEDLRKGTKVLFLRNSMSGSRVKVILAKLSS